MKLERLQAGMVIPYGGSRAAIVTEELASRFEAGDHLVVVQSSGALLHIPAADQQLVHRAVTEAAASFAALRRLRRSAPNAMREFFESFARHLEDDETFAMIAAANTDDVERARTNGRSTTRLLLTARMRSDMIDGLRVWRDIDPGPDSMGQLLESHEHPGWVVEQRRAPLGVVAFVFEGRPNVFADATGVLQYGNTVVLRIGSDALATARAIMTSALEPALRHAGLPEGSVRLIDSADRSAGWALFSDPRVSLAVARGSGTAVEQLGAVARQAGVPVSLHGTGGGWIVAGEHADPDRFNRVVRWSLDRKVCNTLNVCVVLRSHAADLVPRFLAALSEAGAARGVEPKLHAVGDAADYVEPSWFTTPVPITRADGLRMETRAQRCGPEVLSEEWEWEDNPEVTLVLVDSVDEAVGLCNTASPRLVASLISTDDREQGDFWDAVDVPFVGDGFTRWVDGQFALNRPELGLSNWHDGRLFSRSAVLSGDSVFTIRTRVTQSDPELHR